ncbi:MAG: ribosome small subunit-dependent GTPase A [Ilumatobacteraceae bacterium]
MTGDQFDVEDDDVVVRLVPPEISADDRAALGWDDDLAAALAALDTELPAARVSRLDRGWSTALWGADGPELRLRNIGADVAVGDWIVASIDGERVEHVLPRRSAFVRRASFEGARGESHTVAANIDDVFLLHSLTNPPNPRRLERELVLAFDSGARPTIVLTKLDAVDDPSNVADEVRAVALGVPVVVTSSRSGTGLDQLRPDGHRTIALLGASGVGKSTLVNALVGGDVQRTADVRDGDQRGRHTTTATQLVHLPGKGWLIDTPGLRAVSLWSSGHGIERAFADVFDLVDHCRFRDCKHEQEPGCAVQAAIEDGRLDPIRLESMKRLVAEEAALEDEQRERERAQDRRRGPRHS